MLFSGVRGQFYLLTAVILCVATFAALSSITVPDVAKDKKFEDVVENFILEAPKVINYAILNNHNITGDMLYFEQDFTYYLESLNADVFIIYLIHIDNYIYIKNLYNKTIQASNNFITYDIPYNILTKVPKSTQLTLSVDGMEYSYEISEFEQKELKLLFIKKNI